MTPRPMRPDEEARVRALYAACHPTWPDKPDGWWFCHPTLVLMDHSRVVGSTSFSVTMPPSEIKITDEVMWGSDVCVHPDAQGRGYGRILFAARWAWARKIGVHFFLGLTWPSNGPMIRLFESFQCDKFPKAILNAYPHNKPEDRDGVMYTKGL